MLDWKLPEKEKAEDRFLAFLIFSVAVTLAALMSSTAAIAAPPSDTDRQHYHTHGGVAMLALGRVPRISDVFERGGYRFEIVDMDGNRVDRVLVSLSANTRVSGSGTSAPQED